MEARSLRAFFLFGRAQKEESAQRALDLTPCRRAQLGASQSDVGEHVIVEVFDAVELRPIAQVLLDGTEQGCKEHRRYPRDS